MKKTTIALTASMIASGASAMTDTELKALSAELISLNGFSCTRVLSVQPTAMPDIWKVSCMADSAMDTLVTFRMDARTGIVSGS